MVRFTGNISSNGNLVFKDDAGDTVSVSRDGRVLSKFVNISEDDRTFIREMMAMLDYKFLVKEAKDDMQAELNLYKGVTHDGRLPSKRFRRLLKLQEIYKNL
jgi:hypothetical protein